MTVGIYKLEFIDGSFYVGRSVSIESRYKDHISTLKRNTSGCRKLQNKYNELGVIPIISILEECHISDIKNKEELWITSLDAINLGLNILPGGEDILLGEKHPNSKYTNLQILEVINLLGIRYTSSITHDTISDLTGVSVSMIKDIISGRAHTWAKEVYPNEYNTMLSNKEIRRSNSLKNLNPFANKKTLVYPLIISPEGAEYQVEHLTNFCKEHKLTAGNLSKVFKGERPHHKGWKLKENNGNV